MVSLESYIVKAEVHDCEILSRRKFKSSENFLRHTCSLLSLLSYKCECPSSFFFLDFINFFTSEVTAKNTYRIYRLI